MAAIDTVWRDRLLGYLDGQADRIVGDLIEFVRIPSVSGTDEENEIQHLIARRLAELGVEVDAWEIALSETLAADDFPGVEVDRTEAWGTVGRLPGAGDGQSLLLNAHVDVVPPGDLRTWGVAGPFGAAVRGDRSTAAAPANESGASGVALGRPRVRRRGSAAAWRPAARHRDRGGGRRSGDVRPAAARLACRRLCDPRADVVGHRPGLQWRAHVPAHSRGLAAHASRRLAGVSAIEKFISVFVAIRRFEAARNEVKHPLMTRWKLPVPIEVGMIKSGDWASSVPDVLTADGRLGVAIGEDVEDARQALTNVISEACAADPWLREHPVRVEWWGGQFAPD